MPKGGPLAGAVKDALRGADLAKSADEKQADWRQELADDDFTFPFIDWHEGTNHEAISKALRDSGGVSPNDLRAQGALNARQATTAEALDGTLFDAPPLGQPSTLWRGIQAPELNGQFDKGELEGTDLVDDSFVSASHDMGLADFFAGDDGILARLDVLPEQRMAYMDPMTGKREGEFLLPRGMTYNVTGAWLDGDRRMVSLAPQPLPDE